VGGLVPKGATVMDSCLRDGSLSTAVAI